MFLVTTNQNAASTQLPIMAPRLLTDDPEQALKVARGITRTDDVPFIASIVIYELNPERLYVFEDSMAFGKNDRGDKTIVYVSWYHPGRECWIEKFYGSFVQYNPVYAEPKFVPVPIPQPPAD